MLLRPRAYPKPASRRCSGAWSRIQRAAEILAANSKHPMAPLLHHYELPTWVLYARAYGTSQGPCEAVRAIDRELRAAVDPIAWLETHWIG